MYMPLLPSQTITSVPETPRSPLAMARHTLQSTAMPLGNIQTLPILKLAVREPVCTKKNSWMPISFQGIQVYVRCNAAS